MNLRLLATTALAAAAVAAPALAEHENWAMIYGATVSQWDLDIDADGHIHGTTVWSDAQHQDPVDGSFDPATGYELRRHTSGFTQVFRVGPSVPGSSVTLIGNGWALFQGSCSQGHCDGHISAMVKVSPSSPPLAKGWIH
jgi:hypothetical protein